MSTCQILSDSILNIHREGIDLSHDSFYSFSVAARRLFESVCRKISNHTLGERESLSAVRAWRQDEALYHKKRGRGEKAQKEGIGRLVDRSEGVMKGRTDDETAERE